MILILEACKERAKKLNPNIKIFEISARTGEGIDGWVDWLRTEVKKVERNLIIA